MSSQKKSSRLEGKDLITIGIYTVIYVVIVMLVAMLGFIPIFIPLMAVLCPLIGGIPYMLYVTKAKKFGMTAIMGFLIGLIMVFFGNGYLTMVTGLVGGLLADVILKKADYKSAVTWKGPDWSSPRATGMEMEWSPPSTTGRQPRLRSRRTAASMLPKVCSRSPGT